MRTVLSTITLVLLTPGSRVLPSGSGLHLAQVLVYKLHLCALKVPGVGAGAEGAGLQFIPMIMNSEAAVTSNGLSLDSLWLLVNPGTT